MTDKPRIRIVSEGPLGNNTKVFTEDGTEISNAITEIDLHIRVAEVNTAELKAILVGAEIDAVVTDLQTKILPPPLAKIQYRLKIEPARPDGSHWTLTKLTPLPTYGVREEVIGTGVSEDYEGFLEVLGE